MADPDRVRGRALGALAAVVAVALGVGGILAVGAYAAARMAGLTGDNGAHAATTSVAAAPTHTPSASTSPPRTPAAGDSSATPRQEGTAQHAAQRAKPTHQPQPHRRQQDHRRQQAHRSRHRTHRHAHAQARRHQRHQRHQHRSATGAVTLYASQTRARAMSRVDLGGRCGCRNGTRLVVQRLEHGHWARFPASATVYRRRFHTWVMTGRRGPNQFRVVLPGGPASDPVTVTIG